MKDSKEWWNSIRDMGDKRKEKLVMKLIFLGLELSTEKFNGLSCRKLGSYLYNQKKLSKIDFEKPCFEELKCMYDCQADKLTEDRFQLDTRSTYSEELVEIWFKTNTRLKFYHLFWIGNHCVDFFTPSIKGTSENGKAGKGLVVEVDDSIHDREFKQRKDELMSKNLMALNIPVTTIKNGDLNEATVQSLFSGLSQLPKTTSRERKKILRRIYLETIITHREPDTVADCIYHSDFDELWEVADLFYNGGQLA